MGNNVPEISIIVPVYNVEKYLDRCIKSILNQTFKNFEVILVDDGSTDKSGDICDKFAKLDPRVKVIHKKNTGAASSRNIGLDRALGKYIGFVDSDDYIDSDMYQLLYNLITKYNTDIAVCGLVHEYSDKVINPFPKKIEEKVTGLKALEIALIGDKFSVNVYNKIFKRELFDGIRFPDLKFAEDGYVLTRVLYKSAYVAYNTVPKYHWVRHSGSVTMSNFNPREWEVVQVYTKNLDFIKTKCPSLIKEALCRYYLAYFWIVDKMALSPYVAKTERKKAVQVLKKGYFEIISNPYFNYKRKIGATVLMLNWNLYKMLIKMIK